MFVFGHLGIGSKIVSPWTAGLSRRAVLVGTVLPDLIDKPLYWGAVAATGKYGADIGLISSTRTFGHTALLLVLTAIGAIANRSKLLAALALGMATHLFLDNLSDRFLPGDTSALVAMTWPLLSRSFAASAPGKHVLPTFTPFLIGDAIVGIALLFWDQWK